MRTARPFGLRVFKWEVSLEACNFVRANRFPPPEQLSDVVRWFFSVPADPDGNMERGLELAKEHKSAALRLWGHMF